MLLSITTSNFLSFKDEVTLTFASNNSDTNKTIPFGKYYLNKTNVIYGANASGKSNFLKVMRFIKNMITLSHDQTRTPTNLGYKKYMLASDEQNSFFEVAFIMDEMLYNYSFMINSNTEEIEEETLMQYTSQKPTTLYSRKKMKIKSTLKFDEAEKRKQFIRPNALALSIFSNTWWKLSMKIREFFATKIHIFGPEDGNNPFDTFNMFDRYKENFTAFLEELLHSADLNIKRMEYTTEEKSLNEIPPEQIPFIVNTPGFNPQNKINVVQRHFVHSTYDYLGKEIGETKLLPNEESTGTNRLVNLSGSLYNVMENGMTLFIDELDSSLHPLLVKAIVEIFNSDKNTKWAQLVFTSHDVSLLDEDIFHKDQIRFTDKNKRGESSLYSMNDYTKLSSLKSFQKAYLQGKFDAIPSVREISFTL